MAPRRDHPAPAPLPRSRGYLVACLLVSRQLVSPCHSLCRLQKIHSEAPLHWNHGNAVVVRAMVLEVLVMVTVVVVVGSYCFPLFPSLA